MRDTLSADALMAHVRALADTIGPRPPGHPPEQAARDYITRTLREIGFDQIEAQPFRTVDTPYYGLVLPHVLAQLGGLAGLAGRAGHGLAGAAGWAAAVSLWHYGRGGKQPLELLAPRHPSANLIVRIPPAGPRRRTAVLVGHTDTQKYRPSFEPGIKHLLTGAFTAGLALIALKALGHLLQAADVSQARRLEQAATVLDLLVLAETTRQEQNGYVAGANDNATAVACLLGLGAALRAAPLQHTEVWLAFTGAEEVMCRGMHELLDREGQALRDAWFIDFEMVGGRDVAYVTRHSGLSYLNAYRPDAESLALAEETARAHPQLEVAGRDMVIVEEVGTLRTRGYRGICIAGVGPDGWLENWHLHSDVTANLHPDSVERAARFGLAMLQRLDQRAQQPVL